MNNRQIIAIITFTTIYLYRLYLSFIIEWLIGVKMNLRQRAERRVDAKIGQ